MKRILLCITLLLVLLWMAPAVGAHGLSVGSGTTFSLGSSTLSLSGDWSNSGTFSAGTGNVVFSGAGGNQTIGNPTGETFYNVTVSKAAGDVQLLCDAAVSGTLTVTSGDVDLNGNVITLGSSGTLSESPGATVKGIAGHITATRDLDGPSGLDVAGMGAIITSPANMGSTTVNRGHAPQSGAGNTSILRYYDILPTNNGTLGATLAFHYDDSELNGLTEDKFVLFRSADGGTYWTNEGGIVAAAANTVTKTGILVFSRWTLGESGQPLSGPEMEVEGNGIPILNGDTTPATADNTDFGYTGLVTGGVARTFVLLNTGTENLTLTDPSPYVTVGGAHGGDFSVSSIPSNSVLPNGSTTFNVTFNPSAVGLREATVSIANDDWDRNPYTFSIQGTALPDVTISGTVAFGTNPLEGATVIFSHDGHREPTAADGTYSYIVPSGTTTTVTAFHPGYIDWIPRSRQLTNLLEDRPDQDFTATTPAIPTLSEWGMIVFALLMAGVAIVFLRKRRNVTA